MKQTYIIFKSESVVLKLSFRRLYRLFQRSYITCDAYILTVQIQVFDFDKYQKSRLSTNVALIERLNL